MDKDPKSAVDASAPPSPDVLRAIEALRNNHDLEEAVREHGPLADRLCATCNIPKEHRADLCAALQRASDAYDDVQTANARKAGIRANAKHLRGFQRKLRGAFKEYGLIDERVRVDISSAVVAKREDWTGIGRGMLIR